MTSVYVVLGEGRCITRVCSTPSMYIDVSHQVAICSSMLYDVSSQGEQYSMYM